MVTLLFSLPVHEGNETIRDTIANVRKHNGEQHHIMLHVSRHWDGFDSTIADLPRVHVNPMRWPTGHAHSQVPTHVSNVKHAESLSLPFTHVVILHTSELFVRAGMSAHVGRYEFSTWFTPSTQPTDITWPPMNHAKALFGWGSEALGNLIEGSWWSRQLFNRMSQWILDRAGLEQWVLPVALEECVFPTLAWHLSGGANHTHPYCAFKHDQHFLTDTSYVDDIREGRPIIAWQAQNFTYDWQAITSDGFYSVKRIARDIDDPMRRYIRSL